MLVFAVCFLQFLSMSWIKGVSVFVFVGAVCLGEARAQSSNMAYQLANLSEDVRLLTEQISLVRLEMDELRRENEALRQQLKTYEGESDSILARSASVAQLEKAVSELKGNDAAVKEEVLVIVNESMAKLTTEVGKIIGKMGGSTTTSSAPVTFDSNFPKTGINYVVLGGDTLSKIATKNGSRVHWIRSANKIVDPTLIQPGQSLFIPIEQ